MMKGPSPERAATTGLRRKRTSVEATIKSRASQRFRRRPEGAQGVVHTKGGVAYRSGFAERASGAPGTKRDARCFTDGRTWMGAACQGICLRGMITHVAGYRGISSAASGWLSLGGSFS